MKIARNVYAPEGEYIFPTLIRLSLVDNVDPGVPFGDLDVQRFPDNMLGYTK